MTNHFSASTDNTVQCRSFWVFLHFRPKEGWIDWLLSTTSLLYPLDRIHQQSSTHTHTLTTLAVSPGSPQPNDTTRPDPVTDSETRNKKRFTDDDDDDEDDDAPTHTAPGNTIWWLLFQLQPRTAASTMCHFLGMPLTYAHPSFALGTS